MVDVRGLVRKNILRLKPYSSARDEFDGNAAVFLDANENAYGSPLNRESGYHRYPDPHQRLLKQRLSQLYGAPAEKIFLGNGSDEAIDLLMRVFGEPGRESILIMPPTYGMYEVCANINDLSVEKAPLTPEFDIDFKALEEHLKPNVKLIFICSPNNPTGNTFPAEDIERIVRNFSGIVVVDEAYIDFAPQKTVLPLIDKYSNLVILRTFSKAWGSARIRLGIAFGDAGVISFLNKIKMPYNVSGLTQEVALQLLKKRDRKDEYIQKILRQRRRLSDELRKLAIVQEVFPSDANFILVRFKDAKKIFDYLMEQGIIVRDRSSQIHCENCLRITVGTEQENDRLLSVLKTTEDNS
ncbi:MAG: histidinol-phosphate transaminase [Calditrichaeota bacterium]|nr:histidinol-phosphate transaminase [Calditrichota bacterium]